MLRCIVGRLAAVPVVLCIGLIVLGLPTASAVAASESHVVTLTDVLRHAEVHSPLMQLANMNRALGAEQAKEIVGPLQPHLSADVGLNKVDQSYRFDPICFEYEGDEICLPPEQLVTADDLKFDIKANNAEVTLSLRSAVWSGGLVQATRSLGNLTDAQAGGELEAATEQLVLQLVDLYYGVLQADYATRLVELALREARLDFEEIEWQQRTGTATSVDVQTARAKLLQLQGDKAEADGGLKSARIALNHLAGYELHAELNLVRPTVPPAVFPTVSRAVQLAMDKRVDLKQAQLTREMAQQHETVLRLQHGPSVQAFASLQQPHVDYTVGVDRHGFAQVSVTGTRQWFEDDEIKTDTEGWVVGINASWAFVDPQRRAVLNQAELRRDAAAMQVDVMVQGLEAELQQAEARALGAHSAWQSAGKALEAIVDAEQRLGEMHRRGAVSDGDVLHMQLTRLGAEQQLLAAEYAYVKARLHYLQSAGLLLEDWF